jgi:protocatechuate 3,4-dioxygenase beta subunit
VTVTHGTEPTSEESGVFNNNVAAVPDANSNLTVDFGFYTQQVGTTVWLDNGTGGGDDDNGIQDGTEAGVPGVTVRLFSSDGAVEIPVGADGILGTADDGPGGVLTDATGAYAFGGLPQGSYVVAVTAPAGYTSSTDPVNGATPLAADLDDNGTGTGGGIISSNPFTLTPGSAANGSVPVNSTGSTSNPRVDFGLVQAYDLTIVKTITSSGPYTPGSTVTFSLVASNLGPGVALDGLTVSDRLPAGLSYSGTPASGGPQWSCAAPVGQEVTCTWFGPTAGLGNDTLAASSSLPPITITATVDSPRPTGALVNQAVVEPSPNQSAPETIPVGTTPDRYEDGNPATGSNNDDSKAVSLDPTLSLGDLVWIDSNRNGQFEQSEQPISGVTVNLLNGVGGPAVDAFGNLVPSTTTDVNGRYEFTNLEAGDYQVRFTLPSGYVWTVNNTGDDGLDSDPIPAAPNSATATTATFTLTSTPVADADTNANRRPVTNPTIDAGVRPIVSLGDLVWIDDDGDGQFDQTEPGIAGVTVALLDGAGNPATNALGAPVAPVTTDANGRYDFSNLLPGDYQVRFTLPSGYVWTANNTGGDGLDSDPVPAAPNSATATTATFTLTSTPVVDADTNANRRAVTNPTIDAGVVQVVSLGDLVWVDEDRDGQFDQTEPGIAGVIVTLLDAAGNPVTDALGNPVLPTGTDANGRYSFTNLFPGDYQVRFSLPSGHVWTTSNTGNDGLDSDAAFTTNTDAVASSGVFTLSPTPVADPDTNANRRAVTNPTIDAGVVPILSLGDLVWVDEDRDGQFDQTEQPLGGVTVTLLDGAGNPATFANGATVAPTLTDVNGRYDFSNLLPGDYQVRFTLPSGYVWTTSNTGDDGLDSDVSPATPNAPTATTATFTLSPTLVTDPDTNPNRRPVTNPTIDAGVVRIVSLGDLVWVDEDRDGQFDQTEPGISGVTVTLLDGAGNPATDSLGAPVAPVTTDANGRYSFTNLVTGDYQVRFTLPSGYVWTTGNTGDDGLDSDVSPATPNAPTATTATFTLGSTPVTDSDTNANRRAVTNPTIDAGVVPILSLGDLVWVDEDRDGQFDQAEAPRPGVTVTLLDGAGNPAVDADGNPVAPVTTDADGRYQFSNLLPGNYRVEFTLPVGYVWTTSNVGDDGLDSDAAAATPTAPTATTAVFALTSTPVADSDTNANRRVVTNPTLDAGVVPRLSLGDVVWVDVDRDGQLDPTESGIPGATVTLLDSAGNPVTDVFGNPVAATTTDANGRYSFVDLAPGDYRVVFTLPSGYAWTTPNTGADGTDSDAVAATPTAPTAVATVTLSPTPVADTDPSPNRRPVTNPTIDAGVVPILSLGDVVWVDEDRDGQLDPTEVGQPGVTVRLLDAAGNPALDASGNPVAAVTTDANGRYQFDNILPGDYRIEYVLPSGFVWTTPNTGADGTDSDATFTLNTDATARTNVFTLSPTPVADTDPSPNRRLVTNPTLDAGIAPVASLGDVVWIDADRDGQFDPTEAPLPGVTVTLRDGAGNPATFANGNPVLPTTTDANGRYSFANLLPGDYQVVFTLPAGYAWTEANTGGDALDSDAVAATPTAATATAAVTLTTTPVADADPNPNRRLVTNPTIDAGVVTLLAVGDNVWRDRDHDGVQDPDEPPVSGITVTLLNPDLTPAVDASGNVVSAVVTDGNGRYVFDNLLPGDYVIRFGNLPPDFEFTIPGSGGPSDSNAAATGLTPVFTLSPTAPDVRPVTGADGVTRASFINPTIDAGIWNPLVDSAVPPTTAPSTTLPRTGGSPPGVGLPRTGSDVAELVVLATLILGAGALIVAITRRRRTL